MGGRCQSRDEWKVLCLRERGRECSGIFFKAHIYSFREVLYKFCKEAVTCAG